MNRHGIKLFLAELDVASYNITERDNWVNCPCVLAPYAHGSGEDKRPSFGIVVNPEGPSFYYCFGCTPRGRRLDALLHNIYVMSGRYPVEAAAVYRKYELFEEADREFVSRDVWSQEKVVIQPLPYKVLKQYPLLQTGKDFEARRCKSFLTLERHIPVWAQNYLQIRYCTDRQTLVFALTDIKGRSFLLRMRSRKRKSIFTVSPEVAGFSDLEFAKLRHAGVWFNMSRIDWRKPVMLVEGELDVGNLISLGYFNVMGSATSSVTDAQLNSWYARRVILGYDSDDAGRHATRRIYDHFYGRAGSIAIADWTLAKKLDGTPCFDPGDVPDREQLSVVLSNLKTDLS